MTEKTERLGISQLDYYFSKHGWLFREQMIHDYGIDAQVEIVQGGYPTGKLIAFQIKSGESFFKEENDDFYVFRSEEKHINYWANHILPVILVLYHPEKNQLYWQIVNEETVVSTGKGWKIEVPKVNVLNEASFQILEEFTQPDPYIRKLNRLKLDKFWIEQVFDGREVIVEFDDWVNKSLPRFQVSISCDGEAHHWPMIYGPGISIQETLEYYFPWADFNMDLDAHRESAEAQWEAECYAWHDKETGETYYSEDFDDWYSEPEGIVPVDSNGEIESYRLYLTLNHIGEAFLELDHFLSEMSDFEHRVFSIDDI